MDQNTDMNPQTPKAVEAGEKSGVGPAMGAGIVIILLAIGALYFWSQQDDRTQPAPAAVAGDAEAARESWQAPSGASDDAAAIEAELSATDMNAFEQSMNADAAAVNSQL